MVGRETWIGVAILAGIALLLYSPIRVAITVVVLLVAWLFSQQLSASRMLADIRKRLDRLETTHREDFERTRTSYVLQAVVEPNWDAILTKLAEEEFVTNDQLLEKCRGKGGSINSGGWGLWFRSFRFVVFHDELTDLEQIWSDHHRTFIERPVVQGHIFEEAAFRLDRAFKGSVSRRFIVSPSQIGFASPWDPGGDIESEIEIGESLGVIPVAKIISFLLDLDEKGAAMNAVKTLPQPLAKEFHDHGVTYSAKQFSLHHLDATFDEEVLDLRRRHPEKSDLADLQGAEVFSQRVVFHVFETKFFTLRLRLKTHEATDERANSG